MIINYQFVASTFGIVFMWCFLLVFKNKALDFITKHVGGKLSVIIASTYFIVMILLTELYIRFIFRK